MKKKVSQTKKDLAQLDFVLLAAIIIFCIFGCVMVFSASSIAAVMRYHYSSNYFFIRQALFTFTMLIIGMFIIIHIPTNKYKILSPFLLIGIIGALIGLFIYGVISNGAQSWYRIGGFSLQPSEFAKSILIICMAVFYDYYSKVKVSNPKSAVIPLVIGIFIAGLIALQPDLGSAIIVAGIAYCIFLAAPIGKKIKSIVTLIVISGIGIFGFAVLISGGKILSEHQVSRFTFTKPCDRYTENTGYQVCNGYIAFHNGGLFGVGLGDSTQKYLYLPEAHTDFIFPIIVEELGLITGILVLFGYILILCRLFKIAKQATNIRNSILAYGTFLFLLSHILINLLGVLALIPLTGVPLPLLSYGGSFTINILGMLFICERVAIENKEARINQKLAKL